MRTDTRREDSVKVLYDAPLQPSGAFHLWPGSLRTRPPWAAGLPDAALALRPPPRLGWAPGQLRVDELPLDRVPTLPPTATLGEVAAQLGDDGYGWVPIVDRGHLAGIITAEALVATLPRRPLAAPARPLLWTPAPSCAPDSRVVDAVRVMLATHLRRLPVVDGGRWRGCLPLAVAAAAAAEDPSLRDVLESAALSPSTFARPWA